MPACRGPAACTPGCSIAPLWLAVSVVCAPDPVAAIDAIGLAAVESECRGGAAVASRRGVDVPGRLLIAAAPAGKAYETGIVE